MSGKRVWVVTGASRGLGAEFVRQLLLDESHVVIATMRAASTAATGPLKDLQSKYLGDGSERLHLLQLDITNKTSIEAAATEIGRLQPQGIDYLINNAGVTGDWVSALQATSADFENVLKANVVGTFLVTQALLPLLEGKQTRTVVNLSSSVGSCTFTATMDKSNYFATNLLPYHCSKTALNMQTLVLANQLNNKKFTLIMIHPGFVSTDMGKTAVEVTGMTSSLSPDESVEGMLKVIHGLTQHQNGSYLQWNGETLAF